ncbi:hypothetical protein G352_07218 [Rhodococcus ruber BKS 20-38]|uniref:DUF742 domain-containing protein n=1 Tax=Rhodococcus ruber BKS 20-38 TaxID=1278076 RepID=M2ZFC6_9NOCA|nr:DUF742 domain-containing protein [Rhodococcus ruber]EME66007.1 hypothetical protein G352_07218 [Rhodococcus ruber BKS 20-38]
MSVADNNWPLVGATGARFGSSGRRRKDHPAPDTADRAEGTPAVETPATGASAAVAAPASKPMPAVPRHTAATREEEPSGQQPSFVRPFVRSQGRTRAEVDLPLEVLVSAVSDAVGTAGLEEHRTILALCAEPRSIMEIAALARLPLGVARVLVGDLAATGELTVHRTADGLGPDAQLLSRVLGGLRRL